MITNHLKDIMLHMQRSQDLLEEHIEFLKTDAKFGDLGDEIR